MSERAPTRDPLTRRSPVARGVTVAGTGLVAAVALFHGVPGAEPAPALTPDFWAHWGDGQAELDGYALTQPRYGEARDGVVVHIFVTEPFSRSDRVKADPGRHADEDVVQVLKLNEAREFQTGVYDYDTMSSVFVPLSGEGAGRPLKASFSSQEWCGMLYEELAFEPTRIHQRRFSYFDGESKPDAFLERPEGGVTLDALPIRLRGWVGGELLAPGQTKQLPVLPSLLRARLTHRPLAWREGQLRRAKTPETIEVPAGRFEVSIYHLGLDDGDAYTYAVETAAPHRIIRWTGPDGERAELVGSDRMPYWELHGEGAEKHLARIGLEAGGLHLRPSQP